MKAIYPSLAGIYSPGNDKYTHSFSDMPQGCGLFLNRPMSVYTSVSASELAQFLAQYPQGDLVSHHGILAGIENTNYFVTTTQGEYVLTLFEKYSAQKLDYYLQLMRFWFDQGIPTPKPFRNHQGTLLSQLKGKPAALVQRLPGQHIEQPSIDHCAAIGEWLAKMHLSSTQFPLRRAPDLGHAWRMQNSQWLIEHTHLPSHDQMLLQQEIAYQSALPWKNLPHSVIHADLFRDNALFWGRNITGIIDLYFASDDACAYDLAVVLNDWCFDEYGQQQADLSDALLQSYHAVRPLTPQEQQHGVGLQRAAALRFWLSRQISNLTPKQGELTFQKDPLEFRDKLIYLIAAQDVLQAHWHFQH